MFASFASAASKLIDSVAGRAERLRSACQSGDGAGLVEMLDKKLKIDAILSDKLDHKTHPYQPDCTALMAAAAAGQAGMVGLLLDRKVDIGFAPASILNTVANTKALTAISQILPSMDVIPLASGQSTAQGIHHDPGST
jgi:hypothetical protein